MTTYAFERMRRQSHAQIRARLQMQAQQLQLLTGRRDRARSCRYAAHSAYLKCAVNPLGDCAHCPHYAPPEHPEPLI